jgi:hypothetical protein
MDFYKGINPEALEVRNGKRILRPSHMYHSGKQPESETHSPRGDSKERDAECGCS